MPTERSTHRWFGCKRNKSKKKYVFGYAAEIIDFDRIEFDKIEFEYLMLFG
jgi:hypothetical protein